MNLSCFPYFSQCLFKFLEARLHRFSVGCIWVTFSNPLNLYFRSLSLDIDVEKSDGEEASSAAATLAQLGPNLHKLWSYSCNLTKGRNVSCLAWNKLNPVSSHLLKREMKDLSHSENSNLSRGHFSGSAIYWVHTKTIKFSNVIGFTCPIWALRGHCTRHVCNWTV